MKTSILSGLHQRLAVTAQCENCLHRVYNGPAHTKREYMKLRLSIFFLIKYWIHYVYNVLNINIIT